MSEPSSRDLRPTVLLVGDDPMGEAIALALERHQVAVERGAVDRVAEQVIVAAPEAVVLIGDAARDQGARVIQRLRANVGAAGVPVLLVSEATGLDARLAARRQGVHGVVHRSASADAVARSLAEQIVALCERGVGATRDLGEASVEEVLTFIVSHLRSGIAALGGDNPDRIVLRDGGSVSETIEDIIQRVRPVLERREPAPAGLGEGPPGKVLRLTDLIGEDTRSGVAVLDRLRDRRLVLVEQSPVRADETLRTLRASGAQAVVVEGSGNGIELARTIDPEIVIVDDAGIAGWAQPALREIREDLRLRWASLLVVRAAEVWPSGSASPDVAKLAIGVAPLVQHDLLIGERASSGQPFDARLESIGPVRLLRALIRSQRTLHIAVRSARATVELDVAEGLLVGATASTERAPQLSGIAALKKLVELPTGRVSVTPRAAPSRTDIMAPLDAAMAALDADAAPRARRATQSAHVPEPTRPASRDNERQLLAELERTLMGLRSAIEKSGDAVAVVPEEPIPPSATVRVVPPPPTAEPQTPSSHRGASARPRSSLASDRAAVGPRLASRPALASSPRAEAAPVSEGSTTARTPKGLAAELAIASRAPEEDVHADVSEGSSTHRVVRISDGARAEGSPPVQQPGDAVPRVARRARSVTPTLVGVATPLVRREPVLAADGETAAAGASSPEHASAAPLVSPAEPAVAAAPSAAVDQVATVAPIPSEPDPVDDLAGESTLIQHSGIPPETLPLADTGAADAREPPADSSELASVAQSSLVTLELPAAEPPAGSPRHWLRIATLFVIVLSLSASLGLVVRRMRASETRVTELVTSTGEVSSTREVPTSAAAPLGTSDERSERPQQVTPEPPVPDSAAPVDMEPRSGVDRAAEPTPHPAASPEPGAPVDALEPDLDVDREIGRANDARLHGRLDEAEARYRRVLAAERRSPRALAGLARVAMARSDGTTAVHWARRLLGVDPSSAASLVLLGDCLELSGDREGARRMWRRALRFSPEHGPARERLRE